MHAETLIQYKCLIKGSFHTLTISHLPCFQINFISNTSLGTTAWNLATSLLCSKGTCVGRSFSASGLCQVQILVSPLSLHCCFSLYSAWAASGKGGSGSDTHGEQGSVEQGESLSSSQAVLCVWLQCWSVCLDRHCQEAGWPKLGGIPGIDAGWISGWLWLRGPFKCFRSGSLWVLRIPLPCSAAKE